MRLKLVFFTSLAILVTLSNCKLTTIKKDRTIRTTIQQLVTQCRAKGLTVYTLPCSANGLIRHAYNEVLRQIGRVATTTIVNSKVKMSKFRVGNKRLMKCCENNKCTCFKRNYCTANPRVLATDNVLFVYVLPLNSLSNEKQVSGPVPKIYSDFGFSQSSPKMLLLSIVKKKFSSYQKTLRLLAAQGFYNIEVLEIFAKPDKTAFEYKALQLNFFRNKWTVTEYKKGTTKVRWFKDELKSCNGKLTIPVIHNQRKDRRFEYPITHKLYNTELLATVRRMLNTSLKLQTKKVSNAWNYHVTGSCNIYRASTYAKPIELKSCRILVPKIYHEVLPETNRSSDLTLTYLLVVLVTAASVCFLAILARLNANIWSYVTTHYCTLLCLTIIGLFLGSTLISGFVWIAITKGDETTMETHQETIYDVTSKLYLSKNLSVKSLFYATWHKIRYAHFDGKRNITKVLANLLLYKDCSVLMESETVGWLALEKIVNANKNLAKILEPVGLTPETVTMRKQDAFLHRLSDVIWRYYECGLGKKHFHINLGRNVEREIGENADEDDEDDEIYSSTLRVKWLLLFLLASNLSSLIVLSIEFVVMRFFKKPAVPLE